MKRIIFMLLFIVASLISSATIINKQAQDVHDDRNNSVNDAPMEEIKEVTTLKEAIGATGKVRYTGDLYIACSRGKYLYVMDKSAPSLILHDLGTFETSSPGLGTIICHYDGFTISGSIEFTWDANEYALIPVDPTKFPVPKFDPSNRFEVRYLGEKGLTPDMINMFVVFQCPENTIIQPTGKPDTYIVYGEYTMPCVAGGVILYNRFHKTIPQDPNIHLIYGFVGIDKDSGDPIIYPSFFEGIDKDSGDYIFYPSSFYHPFNENGVADVNVYRAVKGEKYDNVRGVESAEPLEDSSKVATKVVK